MLFRIPLIIDDRIDVAMAVGCGVHLGAEDMPISIARSLMGEDAIIGATAKKRRSCPASGKKRVPIILAVVLFIQPRRM